MALPATTDAADDGARASKVCEAHDTDQQRTPPTDSEPSGNSDSESEHSGDANAPPVPLSPIPCVRTGTGPMAPVTFLRSVPETEELYVPPESLFDDIVRREVDRVSHQSMNHTVYDSVQSVSLTGEQSLLFESRFESGNLRRAIQVYEYEYDLILNPDYNTSWHTQWYLFRVKNTRRGPRYRFNIINMIKPTSAYNEGMRPLFYSKIEAATGTGWVRRGEDIAYYQNGIRRKEKAYYTLTFTFTFPHDEDEVYFSHCYPYTFSDLQQDLRVMEQDPSMLRRFRRRKLCDTLAGNPCDLITITSFGDSVALRERRAVVITARVHPGESNASWVMKGILDFLTGTSVDARILRENFVFKIVPMLNPDGVIVGNSRCSLAGHDLNRQWDEPSRKLHPTIFAAKRMMRQLKEDREVVLFIDVHGHSRKKNVFMYGNTGLREKIFPRLLSKTCGFFNFDDCCFKKRGHESTARVVAKRELSINAFTLEASFCGADFGHLAHQHFTTKHFEEMGCMMCDAIIDFCDPDQSKVLMILKELQVLFPEGNSDASDSEEERRKTRKLRKRKGRSEVKTR